MFKIKKLISLGLSLAMLTGLSLTALAVGYNSGDMFYTTNGQNYKIWSTVYIDGNSRSRGGTWVQTSNSKVMPVHNMGTQSIVTSKEDGDIYSASEWRYNINPDYFTFATTGTLNHTGLVYGKGKVELYTGSGYVILDAPQTPYADSKSRAGYNATLSMLQKTLDANGEYPVNASGQTYGSTLLAEVVGAEPELMAAVGVDGVKGYLKAEDLKSGVTTPAEAKAYAESISERPFLPLYDQEGIVVGQFKLSLSEDFSENQFSSIEEAQAAVEAGLVA